VINGAQEATVADSRTDRGTFLQLRAVESVITAATRIAGVGRRTQALGKRTLRQVGLTSGPTTAQKKPTASVEKAPGNKPPAKKAPPKKGTSEENAGEKGQCI